MPTISARGARQNVAVLTLSAIAIAICWAVANQMTTVCPAIYPAPPECYGNVRQPVAGIATLAISALALGVLIAAAFRGFRFDARPTSFFGSILGVAVAVGPLAVVLRAGFAVDLALILIVLASIGAGIGIIVLTRRRATPEEPNHRSLVSTTPQS